MAESADLQGVFTRFLPAYRERHRLDARRRQVCGHIGQCRTAALGGRELRCEQCDYTHSMYYACRDRHCPKCQHRATERWCEAQRHALLPVTYHHLVFTLPHRLNAWAQVHPQLIYRRLYEAVWATLKAFGADPKRLGGELGMSAVLHTWGQTLSQHIHLHCLLPGGVLTAQGEWRAAKSTYLFPVRALSRHFRGRMVSALRQSAQRGELHRLTRAGEVDTVLGLLMKTDWVVYTKPCVSHTDTVVRYLGRYTHRIAISDRRVLAIDAERVTFRYKDYRDTRRHKTMSLEGEEFIRRFLLHVLPKGFMRVRHYGFLANRCRQHKLAAARESIDRARTSDTAHDTPTATQAASWDNYPCPKCRGGTLRVLRELPPTRAHVGHEPRRRLQ